MKTAFYSTGAFMLNLQGCSVSETAPLPLVKKRKNDAKKMFLKLGT